jgi:hypothetical protein
MDDLRIIFKQSGKPHGIRDLSGYLFHFVEVQRYQGQEARYKRELQEQFYLAEYLLESLKKYPVKEDES